MSLNVIIATPEAAPFAKTGGLADVSGALPVALRKLGLKVALFMPLYRQVVEGKFELETTGLEITVPIGKRNIKGQILRGSTNGVPVYFIKRDEFYDRTHLYSTPEGDYFDNLERFVFFSRGLLEALKVRGFKPDVIHCNDWQTGLVPAYLKDVYGKDPHFSKTVTVFTIHNIAYQGIFPSNLFDLTGLSSSLFNPEGIEYWGKFSLLKSGIVFSDIITTVSVGYSREILTPEYGYGMEGVLKSRQKDLYGVVNGVDYTIWNPESDRLLPANYSDKDLKGKEVCKKELIKAYGLRMNSSVPVVGLITRLADQKGLDILSAAMEELMGLDLAIVILGTGDKKYHILLEELAGRYPEKLGVKITFDDRLAHLIEAGSDIFLMPSRYEPCGLNQIYSLKYGTIPVVRATGGLDDTVRDYNRNSGNGFKFKEYSSKALVEKIKEAIRVYKDKRSWETLQKRAMKEDFSWERSAGRYYEFYDLAIRKLPKTQASMP